MSHASPRRLGAALALLAGLGVAAGGGGDPVEASADAEVGAASTLLDDSGLPMPSDPGAIPSDKVRSGLPRFATRAQAADLRRALGTAALRIEVGCCGDSDVDVAFAAAAAQAEGTPLAVLLEGSDLAAVVAAAERIQAAGLERVWVVAQ